MQRSGFAPNGSSRETAAESAALQVMGVKLGTTSGMRKRGMAVANVYSKGAVGCGSSPTGTARAGNGVDEMDGHISPWMYAAPVREPTVIQHFDGLAAITLSKLSDDTARLLWVFDEDHPEQKGLAVHLTDEEAQTVFDTPAPVGLLERVRSNMTYPAAVLWRCDQRAMFAQHIAIPRGGDENSFRNYLERVTEEGLSIGPLPAVPFHESIAVITGEHR